MAITTATLAGTSHCGGYNRPGLALRRVFLSTTVRCRNRGADVVMRLLRRRCSEKRMSRVPADRTRAGDQH